MGGYQKYKDSSIRWLDAIPLTWDERKIGSFAYVHGRIGFKGYSRDDLVDAMSEGAAVVLGGTNIEPTGRLSFEKLSFLSEQKYLESPEIALVGDELLITKVGAGTGDCGIYDGRFGRATINPNVMIISVRNSVDFRFLCYQLNAHSVREEVRLESSKAGAQPAINQRYIKQLRVAVPPLETQTQIIEYLDGKTTEIDALVAKLERERELLERYRRELIARTVTRGLNPDAPMHDSGIEWIGDVPVTWKQMSLKSLLRRVSIKNQPDRRVLSVERAKGVVDRVTEGSPDNHNRLPDDLGKYLAVDAGQFVMNKMKAWRGSYGVSQLDGIVSPAYFTFDLDFPDTAFFNWAIRSDAYIPFFARDSYGVRTDQWDFKIAALRSIPFFIPPIHEQQAIVAFLVEKTQSIDSILVNIDGQLELLGKYRKQVINDVVTGKIRVGDVQ